MASSSNSQFHKSFKYDVFLSFRGEDTRKSFIDHLYYALQHKSIHTYKDDERIEKGKRISDELIKSIQDSRFHIIVFSKNYASSSWCLEELVQIMECQKKKMVDQTAYPVFYDVEPSEVRKQSGEFGEVFAKLEKEKAARKWREALKEAAGLAGWELKNTVDGHEAKFIQRIVEDISLELRSNNLSFDDHEKLIGMEARIRDVVSSLEIGLSDVRMIGIKGMGGGGKTTLARAVFHQISIQFEGKSFVENVREISNGSLSGLKSLQEKILSDVLNDKDITIISVYEGKNVMKKMMCGRKVLVVLDDVDNIDQLKALAGELNWFNEGSRIIITTRDEQVLIPHRVKLIRDVNLLSHDEAICLFSRYAFGRESPIQGYKELSRQVAGYAAGLPLTITVLGSFLCGKNELEWKDAIERLKKIPLKETLEKLELSYISLEDDYKEIFLDVACILKYWVKEEAIKALESCGFHARNGLRVLELKSLITISKDGFLGMHDHIEEMGINIVRRLHPDQPNKHSHLWIDEEIDDVLVNDSGTNESTRCIKMQMGKLDPNVDLKGLRSLKTLRFLYLNSAYDPYFNCNFDEVSQYLPNDLRYLSWGYYPFWSLPITFQANNLVTLTMCHSNIMELWKGGERKVLNKLRFLDLSYSMLTTFYFGLTPNLETLCFDNCKHLAEIHIPAECLKLIFLTVTSPSHGSTSFRLRTLDLRLTPNLETLVLEKENDFVELLMPVKCCLKLKHLILSHVKWMTPDLSQTLNLETLKLSNCVDLVELHLPVECPNFISLEVYHSKLRKLDLGKSPNLEKLRLVRCYDLVELQMHAECLNLIVLDLSHSKLKTLDLGLTPNLEWLLLGDCYQLAEIHVPVGGLKNLDNFFLSGCFGFTQFKYFTKELECEFRYLEFGSLSELRLSARFHGVCPLHSTSNLPKIEFTCFFEEHKSSSIGNPKNKSIGFHACTNVMSLSRRICGLQCVRYLRLKGSLQEAPNDLDRLECLETLNLKLTEIKHLSNSMCMLKHLTYLTLRSCKLLEKLPEDLGGLECLEDLILLECIMLRDIPNNICKMKHLRSLNLFYCILVEKLPEELGCIKSLRNLDIEGTSIGHLPLSIVLLEGLHIKGSTLLHQSCVSSFNSIYDTFYHRGTHSKSLLHHSHH